MFNPMAFEEDIELPFGLCIVEVENTRYIHVHVQYVLDLMKCQMLGPNADVISVDSFVGLCCWKIINIDVEETSTS